MHSTAAPRILLGASLGLACVSAMAGNGLNEYAFNGKAYGMAGADLAVSDDTSAFNINPSGLVQIDNAALDIYFEPYINVSNRHTDTLGNKDKPDAPYGVVLGGGYAQRLKDSKVVVGAGFFVQGGAGLAYPDLITPFGTRDDFSSKLGTFKIVPGIGWQASDALSLGASVGLSYSVGRQKVFPNTSFAAPNAESLPFYGFRVDSLGGFSVNGKLGFQYRPDARWVIGGAYTSKSKIKLDDGTLKINYDAAGLGRVTYRDASQKGLAFAQEAGLGAAYRPNDRWRLIGEVNWVDWSSALKNSTLRASRPDNAQAPASLEFVSTLDWRDQYVIVVGAEYRLSDLTTLRAGYDYGRNPIPDDNLNPVLTVIGEHTVAAGFTRDLSGPWEFSVALLYQFYNKARYSNPESPFGPGSSESWDGVVGNITISRRW